MPKTIGVFWHSHTTTVTFLFLVSLCLSLRGHVVPVAISYVCHCEERSDAAISGPLVTIVWQFHKYYKREIASSGLVPFLAMTGEEAVIAKDRRFFGFPTHHSNPFVPCAPMSVIARSEATWQSPVVGSQSIDDSSSTTKERLLRRAFSTPRNDERAGNPTDSKLTLSTITLNFIFLQNMI